MVEGKWDEYEWWAWEVVVDIHFISGENVWSEVLVGEWDEYEWYDCGGIMVGIHFKFECVFEVSRWELNVWGRCT